MDGPEASAANGRLGAVEAELAALKRTIGEFDGRLAALERGAVLASREQQVAEAPDEPATEQSWLASSAALRRVATISFVLVIALVLRTLTDNGILDTALGVRIGIGYALLLIVVGWRRLAGDGPGKRVFPVCGVVLLSALVVEAVTRFEHLGAFTAHGLLLFALVVAAVLGIRYRAPAVAEVGGLVAPIAAIAIGFPVPQFHLTAATLVLAMVVAAAVHRQRRAAWLHWFVLLEWSFFWLLWSFKLYSPLSRSEALAPELLVDWFLPTLAVGFAALLALAWAQCRARPSPFWLFLPAGNVVWACAAAAVVVIPWLGAERWLGVALLLVVAVQLVLARGLSRRGADGAVAAAALAIAAVFAFVPAVWLATGSLALALPLWALAALGIADWSGRLGSGGLRVTAVLLQVATAITAFAAGVFAAPAGAPWASAAVGSAVALLAVLHYRWTRITPPADWYSRLSPTDIPGIATLWVAVAAAFGALRVVIHPALGALPTGVDNAFGGAQSVLLDVIAIAMLLLAQWRHSKPILTTAVLVGLIAGIKVCAADLLALSGMPLVLSVFAFGMTAAVGSVILGRWQRPSHEVPA